MDFTTVADFSDVHREKNCNNGNYCKGQKIYPPETPFRFVKNCDPTQPGRNLCPPCYKYIKEKYGTATSSERQGQPQTSIISLV